MHCFTNHILFGRWSNWLFRVWFRVWHVIDGRDFIVSCKAIIGNEDIFVLANISKQLVGISNEIPMIFKLLPGDFFLYATDTPSPSRYWFMAIWVTQFLFSVVKSSSYMIYLLDLASVSSQKHMLMQSDTILEQCQFLRFFASYCSFGYLSISPLEHLLQFMSN